MQVSPCSFCSIQGCRMMGLMNRSFSSSRWVGWSFHYMTVQTVRDAIGSTAIYRMSEINVSFIKITRTLGRTSPSFFLYAHLAMLTSSHTTSTRVPPLPICVQSLRPYISLRCYDIQDNLAIFYIYT